MKTLWLDTDIGSDIDDALALAYLLARDDCELIGLSTVTEVENQRAQLASALCRIAGRDVPIYPGLPLLVPPRQTTVPQVVALDRWSHATAFPQTTEVTFHDPLAAAALFEPSLCAFQRGHTEIELENPKMLGKTYWTPQEEGPQEIAVSVDAAHFFDHFFSVLATQPA